MSKTIILILIILLNLIIFAGLAFVIRFIYKSLKTQQKYPLITRIKIFFNRYGYLPYNEITQSFKDAASLLKSITEEENYLYSMPWFIVCGEEDSGKTSLINSINIERPIESSLNNSRCKWIFFDQGVLIDVAGDIFLNKDRTEWNLLANTLHNKRKERPIDGIVLTISAKTLLDNKNQIENLIHSRLWQLQLVIGIKFPVYVIVTKCDEIIGFSDFAKSLSDKETNEIFGWSNPHQLDISYTKKCTDDAFAEIEESIRLAQAKIFASASKKDLAGDLAIFHQSFSRLYDPLRAYIDKIFSQTNYLDSFILRGIYFTGTEINDIEGKSSNANEMKLPIFSTDLFKEKIFKEQGLILPTKRTFWANSRQARFLQISSIVSIIIASIVLMREDKRLAQEKNTLLTILQKLHEDIIYGKENIQTILDDPALFKMRMEMLLTSIEIIQENRMKSLLIPFSWHSGISSHIEQLIPALYCQYIFSAISIKIKNDFENIIYKDQAKCENTIVDPHILETAEFLALAKYVNDLSLLQQIIQKLHNLQSTKSIADLAFILHHLFRYQLSSNFYKYGKRHYQNALKNHSLAKIDIDQLIEPATKKLRGLYIDFIDNALSVKTTLSMIEDIKKSLEMLKSITPENLKADFLNNLLNSMTRFVNYINNPKNNWIKMQDFNPNSTFDIVIKEISSSSFFKKEILTELINYTNIMFNEFKKDMLSHASNITGPFVISSADGNILISSHFMTLYGAINLIANQPFVSSKNYEDNLPSNIEENKGIIFSVETLQRIVNEIKNYEDHILQLLLNFNEESRGSIAVIAQTALSRSIGKKLNQSIQYISMKSFAVNLSDKEILLKVAQNLKAGYDFLKIIILNGKSVFSTKTYSNFINLLRSHCINALKIAEKIIHHERIYQPKNPSALDENFEDLRIMKAYNASDLDELNGYLSGERTKLEKIISDYAKILVQILDDINETSPEMSQTHQKWKKLIVDIETYDQDNGANSLHQIEKFISLDIADQNLNHKKIIDLTAKFMRQNFFFYVIKNISEKIISKSIENDKKRFASDYAEVANYFNSHLAGKFPFSNASASANTLEEASKEDFITFIKLLKSKKYLFELRDFCANEKVREFLIQIEFLLSLFDNTADDQMFLNGKYNITINKYEKYLNGHSITIGDKPLTNLNKNNCSSSNLTWHPGEKISLNFKIIADDNIRLDHQCIHKRNHYVSYSGIWAIFRLIAKASKINIPIIIGKNKKIDRINISLKIIINNKNLNEFMMAIPNSAPDLSN